jgi:transcriptional regulator with XRE-family HTH domain
MPPSIQPDRLGRQRQQLADALRELRGASGLSGARLAERIAMSQSAISRIETGRSVPTALDVERILRGLHADEETSARILELARIAGIDYTGWRTIAVAGLHHKQDELRALERGARSVRMFLPAIPSGLLQVPAYARATVTPSVAGAAARDVERVLAARLARQEVLEDRSKLFGFVLTEQAVRWRRAPAPVLAEQCSHMADLAGRENIEIAVVPLAARVDLAPMNVFVIYDERLVTVELFSGEVVLRDPQDVDYHANLYAFLLDRSLRGADAAAFLRATSALFAAEGKANDADA